MNRIDNIDSIADRYDLVIVGAGPAGLAAAAEANQLGLTTLLADENISPGGQIYRAITTTPVKRRSVLGSAYWKGLALVHDLEKYVVDYTARTVVWSVEPALDDTGKLIEPTHFEVGLSQTGKARLIRARRLILATGAIERPVPVPGWTLPGVMTAGAAQIALKSSGLVPEGRTIIAGSGPLLLLLADQLKRSGANIVAVLETTPRGNFTAALPQLADFLSSTYALYGLKLLAKSRFSLPMRRKVSDLSIIGSDCVQRIDFNDNGISRSIECDQVLLHHGIIPNINMASALGCELFWDESVHAWTPVVDDWLESSVAGIGIAGDGAGIAGAPSAAVRGKMAAIAAAAALGRIDVASRNTMSRPLKKQAVRLARGRAFIDRLFCPTQPMLRPTDPSTIICRCEEVRAQQIRDVVNDLNVQGPNQLKAYLRTGMGPCQGRMCGSSIIELIAEQRGVPVHEVGHLHLRMPIKPITLEEIASMPQSQAAKNAVMR
ncbi:NADPH-dependent 2,4-dienoyl-CoA reductase/sulfur reductase-like enzyme [Phyllobacterium myrsinacearum]|uniref:FAD/NAD(P)-dependent oxidoreductase n=1 Tax=Phyllobacterium myrsinacearum TaxID=28101 RepID=UPI001029E9C0|nr:NAD(P)/FAD-dependent oxidoreductase [Phyllobacterium myrsinacearum]RZS74142.1 NADPH-dependent 2,4-dienoyl-CoA reductase/sulfur reductase-like enzyme [Phyllobacterium myrsinacearum]